MPALSLPPTLAAPVVVNRRVASRIMLDLTVYLAGPSEQELEFLIDLYERVCPPDRLVKYKIAELELWPRIANPVLTTAGRRAAAAGVKRPYFEPTRERIRQGRAFAAKLWDGLEIEDPDSSWGFNCQSTKKRSRGTFAFARVLAPLTTDPDVLRRAALAIADNVELYSGHGGLAFVYNTWLIEDAFEAIYGQARRFWGVDVEYMNDTLTLIKDGIKGVNWLTLIGAHSWSSPEIQAGLNGLSSEPNVNIERRKRAALLTAGPQPVVGDQHRPDNSLDPYYAVAKALGPLFLKAHPDFPGERWVKNGNTVGWIRRFLDHAGWR
jgi:hypothetical protein